MRLHCEGPVGLIPACAGSTHRSPGPRYITAAHPRMRGEHCRAERGSCLRSGSSPHARGALRYLVLICVSPRLIPACAGSTAAWFAVTGVETGSSPHARGAPGRCRDLHVLPGLIPACAGSTPPPGTAHTGPGAHPRMRGEHRFVDPAPMGTEGSSPHARGALGELEVEGRSGGLIPACAGSTLDFTGMWSPRGAHPRMRGEHLATTAHLGGVWGSSPHARGAPSSVKVTCWPTTAHPRMRGEHGEGSAPVVGERGSSPHARGAPQTQEDPVWFKGLIPACAGSTPRCGGRGGGLRAHPRMRGEHANTSTEPWVVSGSSPHARGARQVLQLRRDQARLIPACAGSTVAVMGRCRQARAHPDQAPGSGVAVLRARGQAVRAGWGSVATSLPVSSVALRRQRARTSRPR